MDVILKFFSTVTEIPRTVGNLMFPVKELYSEKFKAFSIQNNLIEFKFEDFEKIDYVDSGAYGICFRGYHKPLKQYFAMKFFGYTKARPDQAWIEDEFYQDFELNELTVTAKLYGYFNDTERGNVAGHRFSKGVIEKTHKNQWLVKVSECLKKDIMTALMDDRQIFTEYDASILFTNLLHCVKEIHTRKVLHRDLKPENVMFTLHGKPFDIKLIDFGMAHHLVDGATHVMSTKSYGTKIFLAPESYCETVDGERMYSTQTDTWQCGVILYVLLCANYPFTDDRNIPTARFNTENPSYKKLSEDAKDILHKIFQVDPRRRATPDQLLRHRWITRNTHTQNNLMTEEYISGIRKWKYSKELKNNLKNRFQSCRKMKEKVIESLNSDVGEEQKIKDGTQKFWISPDHFHQLQQEFVSAASKGDDDSINFDAFKQVLLKCDLPNFATEEIFKIFDTDKSGTVDYCEFLLLLSSFRRDHADKGPEHIKCVFEIFDRDGSNSISRDEFSDILVHLLDEEDIEMNIHCLQLFDKIDGDCNGTITLEEFENFYVSIMNSSFNATSSPQQVKKRRSPVKTGGSNLDKSSKRSKK